MEVSHLQSLRQLSLRLNSQAATATSRASFVEAAHASLLEIWPELKGSGWQTTVLSREVEFATANATWQELILLWGQFVERAWQQQSESPAVLERLNLYDSLSKLVQRIWTELSETEVLNSACKGIVELIPHVDRVGIVYNDDAPNYGHVVAAYPADVIGQAIQLEGNWVFERFQQDNSPIVVNDVETAYDELGANREILMNFGVKSIMILPLIVSGTIIGTLGLDALKQRHTFSEAEIDVLSAISGQMAVGLQNAQLFKMLQERTASQELFNQVIAGLPLRSDLNTLLQTTGTSLGQLLGASRVTIHLAEEQG
ncbi:MAG: GAF domain-containing protein [Anaerolineales bacterium]|nr:GAF domain-containing protein [Anaerolineales bacterium]